MYSNGANKPQGHPDMTLGTGHPVYGGPAKNGWPQSIEATQTEEQSTKKTKTLAWFFKNIQIIKDKCRGGAAGSSLVRINQWLGFGAFIVSLVPVSAVLKWMYTSELPVMLI